MLMIFLSGLTSSEKGKAFEEFIRILLSKLGYQIKNVRVRKSGRELDIQAVSKVTGAPILIECKGTTKPVDGPAFSKFYGIYDHEYRKSARTLTGLLISLSGFNSEVGSYYEEKGEEVKQRFKILGPDKIIQLAVEADLVSDDLTVQHLARKSWPFDLDETLLIITKLHLLYRVQLLKKDGIVTHFLVYRAKCEDPTEYEIETLRHSLPILKKIEAFNLSARKTIILELAQSDYPVSIEDLTVATNQSRATIETEIDFLQDRKLVEDNNKGKYHLVPDIRVFCEVSRELVASQYKYDFLLSRYFENMNDLRLAEYCFSRRFLTVQPNRDISVLNAMFRFSPSALNHALFGEIGRFQVTHEHSRQLGVETNQLIDVQEQIFFSEIIPQLLKDLHDIDNKTLTQLPSVVGLLEEYHIAFANSWNRFFEIQSSGITMRLTANEEVRAGQLISADILTEFNAACTTFQLFRDTESIKQMERIFQRMSKNQPNNDELSKMANDIGVCYLTLSHYQAAKQWFEDAFGFGDDFPEIRKNLSKVLKALEGL